MKISELIEELQEYNQEAEVHVIVDGRKVFYITYDGPSKHYSTDVDLVGEK